MSEFPLIGQVSAGEIAKGFLDTVSGWMGREVQDLSNFLQNQGYIAICVIGTVNALFFTALNLLVNYVDQGIEKANDLTADGKMLKNIVLDVVFMGGSALTLNLLLSKLLQYPLSKTTLALISSTFIALRILLKKSHSEVEEFVIPAEDKKETKKVETKVEEKDVVEFTPEEKQKIKDLQEIEKAYQRKKTEEEERVRLDIERAQISSKRAQLEAEKIKLAREKALFESEVSKLPKSQADLQAEKQRFAAEQAKLDSAVNKLRESTTKLDFEKKRLDEFRAQLEADNKKKTEESIEIDSLKREFANEKARLEAELKKYADEKEQARLAAEQKKLAEDQAQARIEWEKQRVAQQEKEMLALEKKLKEEEERLAKQRAEQQAREETEYRWRRAAEEARHREAMLKAQAALKARVEAAKTMVPPTFTYANVTFKNAPYQILIECQNNADMQKLCDKFEFATTLKGKPFKEVCTTGRVGSLSIYTGAKQIFIRIEPNRITFQEVIALLKQLGGIAALDVDDNNVIAKDEQPKKP